MIINPTRNHILIKEINTTHTTESGIVLLSKDGSQLYEVVAIGPDVKSTDLKISCKVLSRVYEGNGFVHEGVKHYMVKEEQLVAIVETSDES